MDRLSIKTPGLSKRYDFVTLGGLAANKRGETIVSPLE
jgi:hypothetical protein